MSRYLSVYLPTLADPSAGSPETRAQNLERVADWCRRFTPLAASDAPDGVVLDIAGAAHLFGGEAATLALVESKLARHGARAALADTPEAAWALARFGPQSAPARILPAGDAKALARAMDRLPVAALRIAPDAALALSQTGLKQIGDIALRPRAPITARFGAQVFARYDAMMGAVRSAISPRFEAPAYVAERRFADSVTAREHIDATILALAQDLSDMLTRHHEGARKLAAILFRVDGAVRRVDCATSRPQRDPKAIARLFREKLDAVQASDALDAGYGFDLIRLAVMEAEGLQARQDGLGLQASDLADDSGAGFARAKKADALADFLDRMSARFGAHRVLRFVAHDTHIPELASGVQPAVRPAPNAEPVPVEGARPLRLFARPELIEAIADVPDGPPMKFRWRRIMHEVAAIEGPERIAPEWWKQEAASLTRDYFRVEDTHGRRFWLFREGLYGREAQRPRWYVQGFFG
ncbi:MAG: hypothetical protein JWN93_1057 [Hyphomicrobiales bacterium]|nr:hypothetical protein [Hyphomicrobiales bacterium]